MIPGPIKTINKLLTFAYIFCLEFNGAVGYACSMRHYKLICPEYVSYRSSNEWQVCLGHNSLKLKCFKKFDYFKIQNSLYKDAWKLETLKQIKIIF